MLLPDGNLEDADIVIAGTGIASVGDGAGAADTVLQVDGLSILPGIVDLHGDAFERQIMPRPEVFFPLDLALRDTDRQMVANGITTAFHGITWSWEPGLRSREMVIALLDAIEAGRNNFGCDTRFHLRYETSNLEAADEIARWLEAGRIDLLAFNDHLPSVARKIAAGQSLATYMERTGLTREGIAALVDSLNDREHIVAEAVERLAAIARGKRIAMASHDDETAATRRAFHALGCRIAEFPLTIEASQESNRLGDAIVLGAPNIVRGGSHLGQGGVDAAAEIAAGRGDILCSDYYYPALLQAPFALVARSIRTLGEAWRMVSSAPARAAGLADRGEIAPGKRADLVILNSPANRPAEIAAVLSGGTPVYRSGLLA